VAAPLRSDPPIYLAGVNQGMIEAAGALADGLIGHPLFTRSYVNDVVRPALDCGSAVAGRNTCRGQAQRGCEVRSTMVPVDGAPLAHIVISAVL
jgi:alkanesulfonate monooxygenase SsuD/methylene tetrahydromethanopterin reductase-like flavin-dependent oxidoreductase (luciferase family)